MLCVQLFAIHAAVKANDLRAAMGAFRLAQAQEREAVAEGTTGGPRVLSLSALNSLMFVACGGEQWERVARGLPMLPPPVQPAAEAPAATFGAVEQGAEASAAANDSKGADADAAAPLSLGEGAQLGDEAGVAAAAAGPRPTREQLVEAACELWAHMQVRGCRGWRRDKDQSLAVMGRAGRAAWAGHAQGVCMVCVSACTCVCVWLQCGGRGVHPCHEPGEQLRHGPKGSLAHALGLHGRAEGTAGGCWGGHTPHAAALRDPPLAPNPRAHLPLCRWRPPHCRRRALSRTPSRTWAWPAWRR